MLDLDAIRARLAAATPGPWTWEDRGHSAKLVSEAVDDWTCDIVRVQQDEWLRPGADAQWVTDNPDADLIAHAPADLAALLARVDELEAQNESLFDRLAYFHELEAGAQ